jgi:hypothetical protein
MHSLLRMLLVCIRIFLKSVLRYKYLILDSCHPDTIYVSKDVRIRYFSKPRRVSKQRSLENTAAEHVGFLSDLTPTYGTRPHDFRKYAAVCLD